MIARGLVALIAALLIGVVAVRNAAVQAWSETAPKRANAAWSDHPDAQISVAMIEIAQAIRNRQVVPATAFRRIDAAALRAPLAPEPFLVHGVKADLAGDSAAAERDFVAAQRRDPRSLPAAYFLAERYFRNGDARRGLVQIAVLSRLAPGGRESAAPYLAAYAQNRANWPQLRALFAAEPSLGDSALQTLALDPANAPIILALADQRQREASATWVPTLLSRMVAAGRYGDARAIWASVSGVRANDQTLLFDPGFGQASPPPPFNWDLTSSTVGIAERVSGGSLHTVFYGQEGGPLARQLLVLSPGTYRLSSRVAGGSSRPESLYWLVRCDKANTELGRVRLDLAARGWTFQVPASCPAQWLELTGSAPDLPQQSEVTVTGLSLTRGGGGG
ncbi:MAG: hypothetical protein V4513_09070 [Pseudomonadota bacterium]